MAASERARGRRAWKRCAVLVLIIGAAGALPPASGSAGGLPAEPKKNIKKELAKLKKRADALSKEYRGELIALNEAKDAAQRATGDADRLNQEWSSSRVIVGRLAASSYMTGGLDTLPLFSSGDPGGLIRDAAVVEHLSSNNGRRVQNLQTLAAQANRSRLTAQTKLTEVRRQIAELEGQRERVKKLLAKYKPETPGGGGGGGGGRPDGVTGAKSPIIGNSMTPRMRSVLLAVDGKFGPFSAIGCYRAGDPQDHGSGHACDFMESTGGKTPSSSARTHGDSVAAYATGNASSLGVKYVIWRQRIWDVRSGGGWRAMSDRGSVTANHYDHVHISVL